MRAALSGEYNWQVPDSSRDKGTYSEVIRSRASSRTRSGGAGIKIAAVARQLGVSVVGKPKGERGWHEDPDCGAARLSARALERALRSDAEHNQRRVWSAQDLCGERRGC